LAPLWYYNIQSISLPDGLRQNCLLITFAMHKKHPLARRSLAPVTVMSERARQIGASNLNERLSVSNPRDELGSLATTFNERLDRLSAAFLQQRQFMADATHELRTPVSVIRIATGVALDREHRSESDYRSALTTIDDEIRHLSRVIDDMFRLARADAGGQNIHLGAR
jgi:signal transduction histidine kinase